MEFARRKVVDVAHVGVGDVIDNWFGRSFIREGGRCFPASASYENIYSASEHWK